MVSNLLWTSLTWDCFLFLFLLSLHSLLSRSGAPISLYNMPNIKDFLFLLFSSHLFSEGTHILHSEQSGLGKLWASKRAFLFQRCEKITFLTAHYRCLAPLRLSLAPSPPLTGSTGTAALRCDYFIVQSYVVQCVKYCWNINRAAGIYGW